MAISFNEETDRYNLGEALPDAIYAELCHVACNLKHVPLAES